MSSAKPWISILSRTLPVILVMLGCATAIHAQSNVTAPNRPSQNSSSTVGTNTVAAIATLDGNWYSKQWKYGYTLKDGVGVATSTNSPNFQVGQNIIRLTATSNNTFVGQQVYTDGKFYQVNVKLLADGRLYFEGDKNAKWVMERLGAQQPQTQASQNTQQDQVEACVSRKVDLFRKEVGEGRLIRFDMLEEWRGECNTQLRGNAKPPQQITEQRTRDPVQAQRDQHAPINVGRSLQCTLTGTRQLKNGALVSQSPAPQNVKSVFFQFDGKILNMYYVEPNAPKISPARYVDEKIVTERDGRKFRVMKFQRDSSTGPETYDVFHQITPSGSSDTMVSQSVNMVNGDLLVYVSTCAAVQSQPRASTSTPKATQLAQVNPWDKDFVVSLPNLSLCDPRYPNVICIDRQKYKDTCQVVKNITEQAALNSSSGGLIDRLIESKQNAFSNIVVKWDENLCTFSYEVRANFNGKPEGCRVFGVATAFAVGEPGGIVVNRAVPKDGGNINTCRLVQ